MNPTYSRRPTSRRLIRWPTAGDGAARPERAPAFFRASQPAPGPRPRAAIATPPGWLDPRPGLSTAGSRRPNPTPAQTNPHSVASAQPHHPASRGFLPRGLSDAYRRPRSAS